MGAELTLGAEEELHLIDLESRKLSARAPQVLSKLPADGYSAEIQRTTVETNTGVVSTLDGLRSELSRLRRDLVGAAASLGLGVAAVGTAPRSDFADFELTSTGRFARMHEQYRLLVDEQLICGTQIHVGVGDRDLAVQIAQRISPVLPVLLAISASSPYLNGHDTGYASIRTLIWQRWPSAGTTGPLATAAEYDRLLDDLIASGVIADPKMAYFDVRPSAHAPTLELRVCDACPLIDDAVLIAGLFRAAVRAAEREIEAGVDREPRALPIHRAAMWQAARGGLARSLLDESAHPRPVPAATAVRALVDRLRPELEELGDYSTIAELAEATLARGSSADRQRAAFAEGGELDDVVDLVVRETALTERRPTDAVTALRHYRSRAGDEAIAPDSRPRSSYESTVRFYRELTDAELLARQSRRDEWSDRHELAFIVDGEPRRFDVDLMPRLVATHEWDMISRGLAQRARALECFLRDVYSEQRVVSDGVVPRGLVESSAGWREEARRLPADSVRAPIMGFDLVRNEFGGWRVLEDNCRTPSGAAYAMMIRRLMDDVMPDLPRPGGLLDPASYPDRLRRTLGATEDMHVVLLSAGPSSGAWLEHRVLAEEARMTLAVAEQLRIVDGRLLVDGDDRPVEIVYLRHEGELIDLIDSTGRDVGARILDLAATGGVRLANTPGSGIADDKALYCYVPDLIGYYLGEHPLLEAIPTYRLRDDAERRGVLERIGELVTKPVDGEGGRGVLIGPTAPATAVMARRDEIAAEPERWIAQEVVTLSSHPTFDGPRLEPRHVDLRVFVHVTGTGDGDARVADLALTRSAPRGSLIVNSSSGGGAKDTWISTAKRGASDVRTGG